MEFKDEHELYSIVMEAFEDFKERTEQDPVTRGMVDAEIFEDKRFLRDRTLYVVGETHASKKPVEYVHQSIVPKLNPNDWIILREGVSKQIKDPKEFPPHFYFQELAKLFSIPYHEAMPDIDDAEVRRFIKKSAGVSDDEIERAMVQFHFQMFPNAPDGPIELLLALLGTAKMMRRSLDDVCRVIKNGAPTILYEDIKPYWEAYSRQEFHKIISLYPERTNFLISVGMAHISVFN
ncbi:hypothetical protein HYX08_02360 [Candidatus Woesearchaeota archaeon]|nr:hypothetical protein [Candidatus Woesearchaeota archaeon]